MRYPKKGDKLWFLHDGYPILIQVTIVEIHHGEVDLDEPVEFDITYEDLCWTLDEAIDQLLFRLEESKMLWDEEFPGQGQLEFEEDYTLDKYRQDVNHTLGAYAQETGATHKPENYPDKNDDEWFSLRSIRERRGTARSAFEELYGDN